MLWAEFEDFVVRGGTVGKQYQLGKWNGDTHHVFELLCEEGMDYITTSGLLQAKKRIENWKDKCEWGLQGLRKILIAKFGSLAAAWRCAFDPNDMGRCSKATFLQQVRANGFHGSLKTTWEEMTGSESSRLLRLSDLDYEADQLLRDFVLALKRHYGSLKAGWNEVMSVGTGKLLNLPAFQDKVKTFGFGPRDSKRLFLALDPTWTGEVREENLLFLSYWDPDSDEHEQESSSGSPTRGSGSSPPSNKGSPSTEQSVIGIDAPSVTFEFKVVLSREEYREYLRRRRALRLTDREPLQKMWRQDAETPSTSIAQTRQSPRHSVSSALSARSVPASLASPRSGSPGRASFLYGTNTVVPAPRTRPGESMAKRNASGEDSGIPRRDLMRSRDSSLASLL